MGASLLLLRLAALLVLVLVALVLVVLVMHDQRRIARQPRWQVGR